MNLRMMLFLVVFVSSVGCDQASKRVALRLLAGNPTQRYLGDTFRLLYTENTGAFLGLGANWPPGVRFAVFTLLSSVVVVVALVWFWLHLTKDGRALPWLPLTGGTLLLAGGVGNLWDRITRDGAVIDFMNFGIGSLRTGIFNIADLHIVIGGLLMLWWERSHSSAAPPGDPSKA